MPRFAVVGHVEWVDFLKVPHVPQPGEIVHATDFWAEAGGGGEVAAVQLAKLGGAAFSSRLSATTNTRAARQLSWPRTESRSRRSPAMVRSGAP